MRHLSRLEQRLEQAAQELRQAARHSTPPPIADDAGWAPRGWMVFAVAFGLVILTLGVLPMLTRSADPNGTVGSGSPSTAASVATTTVPAPTTSTLPPATADCSAAGMAMPSDQEGLPEPVAAMRRAISEAAIACDFATLQELADPDLVTSFGGGGFDHLVELEESGDERPLAILVGLFDTPHATEDYEDLPRHYYWPSAFVYDSWDDIPPEDLEALRTIYSDEELEQIAAFGSYAGWRIGITEDGDWKFFVAGD